MSLVAHGPLVRITSELSLNFTLIWTSVCLQLELEVSLNTRSTHYARSKGEQIALNVDGRVAENTFYHRYS